MNTDDVCNKKCVRMTYDVSLLLVGIYVTFPMMVIISFLVAIFGSMGQYDNRAVLIFMVCMFLQMTIAAYGVSRIRAATALANTGSVSGTTNERHGSGPSAPALATAFFMQSPIVRSGGGVRKMNADADSAAAAICTTTTTTTVTAPLSMLASIKKAFDGIAAGFTAPSAADGGYSSLSSDISVHDSPSPMNIITGVPVPAPFTAEQQGTTNWI